MVKKISKKFESFEAEEKWLMELAQDGWRLVSYEDNDVETNTYKFVEDASASELHYQIDYRIFNKKSDYEEYKDLFEESGWTILSKSWFYSKHIFISTTNSKIFSDNISQIERDINRYRMAKFYVMFFIIQSIITAGLYYYFERSSFMGATIFGIGAAIYNVIDARKRRKKIPSVSVG
ncbi:DUF2812 domain-containing protein [Solibacillus sp. FSL R7-0668]|uniref:DUF2812 domain-containing protein n=1 Tax=Solibacillus sp. FSL R7-0668 TaxID=2921688 RepID=UPI0030FBE9A6